MDVGIEVGVPGVHGGQYKSGKVGGGQVCRAQVELPGPPCIRNAPPCRTSLPVPASGGLAGEVDGLGIVIVLKRVVEADRFGPGLAEHA